MEKHLFTPDGIRAFYREMLQYDDDYLINEAMILAEDCPGYLSQKFEIDVSRLEALRMLDKQEMLSFGWCLAIVLINRHPVTFNDNFFSTVYCKMTFKIDISTW